MIRILLALGLLFFAALPARAVLFTPYVPTAAELAGSGLGVSNGQLVVTGGSAGGDAFLASNQTFRGRNVFSNSATPVHVENSSGVWAMTISNRFASGGNGQGLSVSAGNSGGTKILELQQFGVPKYSFITSGDEGFNLYSNNITSVALIRMATNGAPIIFGDGTSMSTAPSGGGGGAYAITNAGNVLLTNNVLTNLGTVANSFFGIGGSTIGNATNSFIGGGFANELGWGVGLFLGGGVSNRISLSVSGGDSADHAVLVGGRNNSVTQSIASAVVGGRHNKIDKGNDNFIGGGGGPTPVEGNRIIGASVNSTIGGGIYNIIDTSSQATISGGYGGEIRGSSTRSAIGGGAANIIDTAIDATIAGGILNDIASGANYSTIPGGYDNDIGASATHATVGGGNTNKIAASAIGATIPGGVGNRVDAPYGFAAGKSAQAAHASAFVWADNQGAQFVSTATNQFLIRASGGVGINTNAPAQKLDVNGNVKVSGSLTNGYFFPLGDYLKADGTNLFFVNSTGGVAQITSM